MVYTATLDNKQEISGTIKKAGIQPAFILSHHWHTSGNPYLVESLIDVSHNKF